MDKEKNRGLQPLNRTNFISLTILFLSFLLFVGTKDEGLADTFRWLLAIFVISILMKPFLCLKAIKPADGGFALSFSLGTAVSFLFAFFFSSLLHIPFNNLTCVLAVLVPGSIATSLSIARRRNRFSDRSEEIASTQNETDKFLLGFALFVFVFFVIFYIRGFKPTIDHQTEQFMDFGFMQSIFRTNKLPPTDIWFANEQLNYYYLGQAAATFLCKASFTTVEYGYNLSLCTVYTALILMVFSSVSGFLAMLNQESRRGSVIGGVVASLATAVAGNGHYIVYGIIIPLAEKITGKELVENDYWFPNSTAYIGVDPDLPDKGKHEFPSYTILLGDLHAHVCNMMFTIPLIVLLLDYAIFFSKENEGWKEHNGHVVRSLLKEIFSTYVIVIGVLTGLYRGVNYWDFPIYFIVSGAVILFTDIMRAKRGNIVFSYRSDTLSGAGKVAQIAKTVAIVLAKGAVILAIGTIVMIPFNLNFVKMASTIKLADNHSQLYKLVILWGIPAVISICLIVHTFLVSKREKRTITSAELAYILIVLCAIGLVIVPELIYVEDIYGTVYARYNTMFKLTYQAFILFGISIGIYAGLLIGRRGKLHRIMSVVVIMFVLLLSGYTVTSVNAWYGNVADTSARTGISCLAGREESDPEYGAIKVILNDPKKEVVVLECAGNSYSEDDKITALTGASTVVGWHTHEWLWRNDSTIVDERGEAVRYFYENGNLDFCREMIKTYNIDYIFVGSAECEKYNVDYNGFFGLCSIAWNSDDYSSYLFKVNKDLIE